MKEDVRKKKMKTSEERRPRICCCEREEALQLDQSIKLVVTNYFATIQEERIAEEERSSEKDGNYFFSCDYNVNQCR